MILFSLSAKADLPAGKQKKIDQAKRSMKHRLQQNKTQELNKSRK
jgi:phage-related tail protein